MLFAPLAMLALCSAPQDPQQATPPPPKPPPTSISEPPPIEDRTTPLPPPRPAEPRPLTEVLALGPLPSPARSPIVIDPWLARIVRGTARAPQDGEPLAGAAEGAPTWKALRAADGQFADPALEGGWAFARIAHPVEEVQLLEVRGPSRLYVDGVPRAGDPYESGLVRIPFVARPGGTDVYFRTDRGRLSATLHNPPNRIFLEDRDATLPDLVRGRLEQKIGSVVVVNATNEPQEEVLVTCTAEFFSGTERMAQQYLSTVRLQHMFPLEIRKVTVPLPLFFEFDEGMQIDEFTLVVSLHQVDMPNNMQISLSQVRFPMRVRSADETYRETYLSSVDESAQYYAVTPATAGDDSQSRRGLVLSLHGAGVEAQTQAETYGAKDWCHVVAPTNRRPYGFDWEDWGRIDALEALADAAERLGIEPERVHLTGHSMGGHGAWLLGALNPNTFAAVAPCAGWSDFWSYGRAWQPQPGDAVEELLARAANISRTRLLLDNLGQRGIFVLHGDADTTVPVAEARALRDVLSPSHPDFTYRELPGAGHWDGPQAVDQPDLFEYLEPRRLLADPQVHRLRFTTLNPAVSARLHWLELQAQHQSLEPSVLEAELDPFARHIVLHTDNVSRWLLDLGSLAGGGAGAAGPLAPGTPCQVEIDGQRLDVPWPASGTVVFLQPKPGDRWHHAQTAPIQFKGPLRAGPFKDAFRNRMVFVYATAGTSEENAWSVRRALYDAEQWRILGNGRAELWSDALFLTTQPNWRGQRNIVIYGHAEMNKAWSLLSQPCPIDARRGKLRVGTRTLERDDLALVFTFPRVESELVAAAVVCGTGPVGERLTEALPYFRSGVAYPDWTVIAPEMLERGGAGVLGAGFFGYDWNLPRGSSAWREP